jgi:hypothetical protein
VDSPALRQACASDRPVSGQALRTTRALERRGFLFVTSDEKVCITEAGHEALQTMGK